MTISFRPATNEEILAKYEGQSQTFEAYARDTLSGIRTKGRSKVRSVDGVPMAVRNGRLEKLSAQMMTIDGRLCTYPVFLTIRSYPTPAVQ